jgi:hypothetical protein
MAPRINIDDEMDRWRFRCPQGHANWEPTNHHYWCQACSRAARHDETIDPTFEQLLDKRTGDRLARDEVTIVTDAGAYDDIGGKV